jgi:hypothetical protein
MQLRVWLDDERDPENFCSDPQAWTWVKTVEEAVDLLTSGQVFEISLDNDLGEDVREGRHVVLWMAEHDVWPSGGVTVHSQNAVAATRMCQDIVRYSGGRYRQVTPRMFVARRSAAPAEM